MKPDLTTLGKTVTSQRLTLPEELILMLLNEQAGYFHQVPGWNLNCAMVGAALAELSLLGRIDTDMDSLYLVDRTETGDEILDPILNKIADDPDRRDPVFWIERLAGRAESIVDRTLDRLVEVGILEHHDGDFWTLAGTTWHEELSGGAQEGTVGQFVKTRVLKALFTDEIPGPRDIVVICLVNACDVFRFMFDIDDETQERIDLICRMDTIGRSIAAAVQRNIASPTLRPSTLTKKIPVVPLRKVLSNPRLRGGNIARIFAHLAERHGPVFQIRLPFQEPAICLAGAEVNRWIHRNGRMYLRSRDYFTDMEKVYGASGLIPSLDGAPHFQLRKAMQPGTSRERLEDRLHDLYRHARAFMADWEVGLSVQATGMSRQMINAQVSPLTLSIESQDFIEDLIRFKERALTTQVARILPKFMLRTPSMKRASGAIDIGVHRTLGVHTPAQRAGCPRDLADDLLSLHASDPQFLPESNLRFVLSTPLLASMYLGDALGFALYSMASQPELYDRIRSEADALFENGDPDAADFADESIDVTRRFVMECLRMYPIVPASLRNVMNSFTVEGYEMPLGARLLIVQTAAHYMSDVFPNPDSFDIDRYLPPRNEHRSPGYAPFGAGHPQVPRLPLGGAAAGRQPPDDRAPLHARGVAGELQAPDQPVSVDVPEQEAEVPRRRAEGASCPPDPTARVSAPGDRATGRPARSCGRG